jgi:hypothetical protein
MPIDISEYAQPRWTRMRTRYPWVAQRNYNYQNLTINPRTLLERYASSLAAPRADGWKAPGYNPNHNAIRTEVVNTGIDTTQRGFKPY